MEIPIILIAILTIIVFVFLYKEKVQSPEDRNIVNLFGIFILSVLIAVSLVVFGALMGPIYDKLAESGQTVFF